MRFKKSILCFILAISIILSVKLVKDYRTDLEVKEIRTNTIESLNDKFDDKIEQQKETQKKEIEEIKPITNNATAPTESKVKLNLENAIGKIIIDKLNLNYPILEGSTEENLNITITRFYGSKINSIGNCVLAGHNMKDGSLFGRLSELSQGDIISMIDDSGNRKNYKIFDIKIVDPGDISVLSQSTNKKRLVTLITCTNQGKSRLIMQAEGNWHLYNNMRLYIKNKLL